MPAPARRADDHPADSESETAPDADADADAVAVDLETLLDQLVRELFTVGLGVAGALHHVEGRVAERLTGVLEDADRLIRTVHSAAETLRTDSPPGQRGGQPADPADAAWGRRRTDARG